MIILYIILGIIAFFLLLGMVPIKVIIKTKPKLSIKVKVLFITVFKTPKKDKPIKLSDYRIKKFRKRRIKEHKKYLYKSIKDEKLKARKDAAEEKEQQVKEQELKEKKSLKEKTGEILNLIKLVVLRAIKKFGKHLKISVYRIRVTVGGSEPDKTAIRYGYVCQAVSYLSCIFDRHLNMKYPGKVENRIYVGCDFSSQKTDIDAYLTLKVRAWHILSTGISALIGYLTMPKDNK